MTMQLELKDKKVLITGSSHGIGEEIAHVLHAEGCRIALNGRNSSALQHVKEKLSGSVGIVGDVTKPEEAKHIVREAVNTLGGLDILICNVGNGRSLPPGNEHYEEWQRVFASNLWSTTNMVEAARSSLAASKGNIVCLSSICGLEVIPGAPVTYSAAKAALNAYVRGIARPLGQEGIRINAIAPGNILFEGSVWADKLNKNANAVNNMLEQEVALKKLGTARNVAELAAYLASPRASFATGVIWTLDGGQIRS